MIEGGRYDPDSNYRFHRVVEALKVLGDARASAELYQFGMHLLQGSAGGIATTLALSEELEYWRGRVYTMCDLYAGRAARWDRLVENIRGLDWNHFQTHETTGRTWSEHNAVSAVQHVAQAGACLSRGDFEGAQSALLQAELNAHCFRGELARAAHPQVPTPSAPLYDDRVAEQQRLAANESEARRKQDKATADCEIAQMRFAMKLADAVTARLAREQPQQPTARGFWRILPILRKRGANAT